jgi:hypothetical protein
LAAVAPLINKYPDRLIFRSDVVAPTSIGAPVAVLFGNYARLFDTARARVRAWEQANQVRRATGKLMLTVIGGVADFEREIMGVDRLNCADRHWPNDPDQCEGHRSVRTWPVCKGQRGNSGDSASCDPVKS